MNNLRKFNWITQYNSAKEGDELVKPSVSLVNDKAVVKYDDVIPPKFYAEYSDGKTYSLECNGNPTLSKEETKSQSYNASAMTSASIGQCVNAIGDSAFLFCSGLTSVIIPNSVESIGSQAFAYCTSLSSIEIPSGVTSIGNRALDHCTSLTSIDIPSGVTSIDDFAFASCTGLTSAIIGCNTSFASFNNCTSLTSITFGSGVTSIGQSCFNKCENVTTITSYAITPPELGNKCFDDQRYTVQVLYVPAESVNAYKTAWIMFRNVIQAIP